MRGATLWCASRPDRPYVSPADTDAVVSHEEAEEELDEGNVEEDSCPAEPEGFLPTPPQPWPASGDVPIEVRYKYRADVQLPAEVHWVEAWRVEVSGWQKSQA